jgi:hypothetical protein
MKKILIALVMVLSLVGTATATDVLYLIGPRTVVTYHIDEPGVNPPKVIDCEDPKNEDPIGCIIAAADDFKQIADRRQRVLKSAEK